MKCGEPDTQQELLGEPVGHALAQEELGELGQAERPQRAVGWWVQEVACCIHR